MILAPAVAERNIKTVTDADSDIVTSALQFNIQHVPAAVRDVLNVYKTSFEIVNNCKLIIKKYHY